ncbi:MAG: tryptophan synthase subunit alpha, partial [Bacteroidales bacterium]|nr:tryptophan synthase subunit alpha [Bacteroidales bacterium]
MNAPIRLMSHLIAGFPDGETSVAIADALVKGGASILEIQLAFSDPSADGPAIQTASTVALEKGYSTKQGLEIVKKIHDMHPDTPIYIMTYGSLAFTPGVENFVKMCKDAGVSACIIPDLPFDNDEGLTAAC